MSDAKSEARFVGGYQIRSAEADGRYLECVATTYNVEHDVGPFYETMDPGVFATTLEQHRDAVKLIVGHDDSVPAVGTPVDWDDNETELRAVYRFLSHGQAQDTARMAQEGAFAGVSVGFLPGKKKHHNTVTRDADGRLHVRRHEARLLHLGLVVAPANVDAKLLAFRTLGVPEDAPVVTPRLDEYRARLARLVEKRVVL